MTDTETRNPFTNRGFIFGAVIVGILILAAIIIALTARGGGDESEAPTATTPAATTEPTPTTDPAAASICGIEGYEETGTLTTAPTADWTVVGTMTAPSRNDVGPGTIGADGVRSCYAHTVEGAVFAATNLWAMGSNARLNDAAIDQLAVPGPGRNAAMAEDQSSTANGGASVQIVGVKVLSYTASSATIDTAFRLNTGALASGAQDLQWIEGDWKVVLTDDGQLPYQPVVLQNLGGYIPWSGTE